MLAYEQRKTRDRTPAIRAAGKLIPQGPGARECLDYPQDFPPTPDLVRQFRGTTRPEPGERRVFHSFAGDPPLANEIRHGVQTKDSLAAKDLLNPTRKTRYQQLLQGQLEQVYTSKRKAPLGSSHDQSPGLPKGMDSNKTAFGTSTLKGESAGTIVSPPKSRADIEQESEQGRELYKYSHNAWGVGEMMDRKYDWSKFTKESLYGVPTPHDNSGSEVRSALHWLTDAQNAKRAPIVSERVDQFRERTQPQLGTVHDPIAETLDVTEDHTFGVMVQPDQYNAGELLHMEGPTTYQECRGFDNGVLSSIRHHLKKSNFYNFEGLLDALSNRDKAESGQLSAIDTREVFFQFNVPLTLEMLEMLLQWCGGGGARGVAYQDLVQLLNWKAPVAVEVVARLTGTEDTPSPGKTQQDEASPSPRDGASEAPPTDSSPLLASSYRTSSQIVTKVGAVPTDNYRSYGVPTIRSDLPAPRIRRVGDNTNYGDESSAYGLMYPSIYSNRGVYEEDFFAARQPEEVRQIFDNIGVTMTTEVFEQLWQEAAARDPKGEVSVESFRAIMEEVQAQQLLREQA